MTDEREGHHTMEIWVAFVFGAFGVIALITLAIVFPHPTPFQYFIFRSVIALSAGGIAALIPGFLTVDVSNWIKAGGGLAVFFLVYFYNPAKLLAHEPAADATSRESPDPYASSRRIELTTKNEIVSRQYFMGHMPNNASNHRPQFQELFYEWSLVMTANAPSSSAFIELANVSPKDLKRTNVVGATIGEPEPRWMSGFEEPAQKTPDFFARTLTLKDLGKDQPAVFAFRRRLDRAEISENDLIRVSSARSGNSSVVMNPIDTHSEAGRLQSQASALAMFNADAQHPHGLPLGVDPGDPPANSFKVTIEVSCEPGRHDKFVVNRLQANIWRPSNAPLDVQPTRSSR